MPLLRCENISKDFPGVRALNAINLEVEPGEIHALCGENGAGKSTLIKILAGVLPVGSYSGQFHFNGRLCKFASPKSAEKKGIEVIYQELALFPDLTVAENIFLGREPVKLGWINSHGIEEESRKILEKLVPGISPSLKVETLSVGMMQLVEIARALHRRCKLLILDEPTSALSHKEVKKLLQILRGLKEEGTSIIYISHLLNEVLEIADRVSVLRNGSLVRTYPHVELNRNAIVTDMVGKTLHEVFPSRGAKAAKTAEKPLLRVSGLSVSARGARRRKVLENITFDLHSGEIVGLAGLMGAGRTELMEVLFGLHSGRVTGEAFIEGDLYSPRHPRDAMDRGVALVTEDRRRFGLMPEQSVRANMSYAALRNYSRLQWIREGILDAEVRRSVQRFDIKTPHLQFHVDKLSGGNQQKIVLSKWLLTRPKLLLLDDPTRGVDVGAKVEIYRLIGELAREGMGILICSSEGEEVLNLAHRILVLHKGKINSELEGEKTSIDEILRFSAMEEMTA